MSSLRDILKKRFINVIRSVKPLGKWKVLVLDAHSAHLLSNACKMYDILEENVTLIENITNSRQPFPDMEAIYILSPTTSSVSQLINDFSKPSPTYAAAHVFFISGLEDRNFDSISQSKAMKHIKTLKELYLDFTAFESRVYTLESPSSFFTLYSPTSTRQASIELQNIAKRLVSVCASLDVKPIIRYFSPEVETNQSIISCKLGMLLQAEMDFYCKNQQDFPSNKSDAQSLFLVLDRTIDMKAPLLHEFTYQAMANDLLEIKNGSKYQYKYTTGSDAIADRDVVLNEEDDLWTEIRHKHIATCIEHLITNFKSLVGENKALGGLNSNNQAANLRKLKDMMSSLPQFQELKEKYSVHLSIAQECMAIFDRYKLGDIAGVEQDMATGTNAQGEAVRNIMVDMVPILSSAEIIPNDKLRLILLYMITYGNVKSEDLRRLRMHAKLSDRDAEAMENLAYFEGSLRNVTCPQEKSTRRFNFFSRKTEEPEDVPYELSRFVPNIKKIVERAIQNNLDSTLYPFVSEPEGVKPQAEPKFTATSLRSAKGNWQRSNQQNLATSPTGKIILFVAGGLTYSEIRSIYELANATKREIYIGTTHIINPIQFVQDLSNLRSPNIHNPVPDFGDLKINTQAAPPMRQQQLQQPLTHPTSNNDNKLDTSKLTPPNSQHSKSSFSKKAGKKLLSKFGF
ncbi:Sec1-like protein [Basidiobolus meristosporus CBS 931.73]|uniref:Sec1-like protein n=1 Tax=Basidiobolus meristosporus CBS 931.73 TaxID=1314790 RepID=A0A1Y1Z379_9FUNG|nr:Sec1-like protein [Basidiobolus meristosporus CBS 931.73]|eukprot:ORY04742.1 Sec1-like protein [Basidiobolus meristosporus CBS 931.73]